MRSGYNRTDTLNAGLRSRMTSSKSPDRNVTEGGPVLDRVLPDFIVIGAMRAGTTTIYHHLNNHPDIGMSRMKETDFFVAKMNYPLGLDWYRSQFAPGFQVYGEVSPSYSQHSLWQGVPNRIKGVAPDVRLIFLARDPVDRFVSQYLHSWHVGYAKVHPENLLASDNGQHMLETSRYASQLKSFLQHFTAERLLVLDFDELCTDPQRTVNRVTDFLGVEQHPIAEIPTRNESGSTSRMPGVVQRAWRSRAARRLDHLITRGMRDRARRILSLAPRRQDPKIPPELLAEVAGLLAEDAAAFRDMTGQPFANWRV